jgi:catechol 2,3-dioxygenase-like lactoylglutathione lyase family enzyme
VTVKVVWYRVRDLDAARAFWAGPLGFEEEYLDEEARWARLSRGETQVALAEGEPEDGGVAIVDVADVKGEAERLRGSGAEVGVVIELHGAMRLVDVFDPDGNRIQFAEEIEA